MVDDDDNSVQVLYFEYKTYSEQVFKIKQTAMDLEKALEKPDTFIEAPMVIILIEYLGQLKYYIQALKY